MLSNFAVSVVDFPRNFTEIRGKERYNLITLINRILLQIFKKFQKRTLQLSAAIF